MSIGKRIPRREDPRLLRGGGRYADDLQAPGQAYACVVRSVHAHARLRGIDTRQACALPGVLAVLTAAEASVDGLRPIPHTAWSIHPAEIRLPNRDGSPAVLTPHWLLAGDRVRFVGEPVALVLAESAALARDAAERVHPDYEPLPAVTDASAAAAPGAPALWDAYPSNICVDSEAGDATATAAAFAAACHVVRLQTRVQRVTGVPMEPRALLADYDPLERRYTLRTGSGAVVRLQEDLAGVLGVEPRAVRVVIGDVGGNYGTRGGFYPEFALAAWAARRIGRPVKWTADRTESFLSDYQGRDLHIEAELALDGEGRFLGLRGSVLSNVGACTVSFATLQKSVEVMSGLYAIPAAHFRARAVMSNTVPTRPYRATGRPEAMYVIERLIDRAALQAGLDRTHLRRLNLVRKLPYCNAFGLCYDSGEYLASMQAALRLGDWAGFGARREAARRQGRLRGIGVANYVDTGTGVTRERAELHLGADGQATLVIGTISNGQGHETSFAQLVSSWLGLALNEVQLVTGDTDRVRAGGGSHSGRSMRLASIVIRQACDRLIEQGRTVAARLLEAAPEDVHFEPGRYVIAGTGRAVALEAVAAAAAAQDAPLRGACDEHVRTAAFPYGCHVCEVEIDPETGGVQIIGYAALDDVGLAVNPLIIDGQTHGGIAQGVGQVLGEHCVYEEGSGQLLSGSFMDYVMPRADTLPSFRTLISEVPASSHPMGIRPGGEGGTTPALAVVANAIADALHPFGIDHLEMPVTPERIWRALQRAGSYDTVPPAAG
jgi:carbon-monoxide dehydrogenase large subunit